MLQHLTALPSRPFPHKPHAQQFISPPTSTKPTNVAIPNRIGDVNSSAQISSRRAAEEKTQVYPTTHHAHTHHATHTAGHTSTHTIANDPDNAVNIPAPPAPT